MTKHCITIALIAILLGGTSLPTASAQCALEPNPDKWLFKGPNGATVETPGPRTFEYATAVKSLFNRRNDYLSVYSFTKSKGEHMLYLYLAVKEIPLFKMATTDHVTIHVPNQAPVVLHPTTDYPCHGPKKYRFTMSFYSLSKEAATVLASAPMDSLVMQYTVLPDPKEGITEQRTRSLTVDNMGNENREKFRKFAECYLKEY
ncbi:MAG: hypothetical protein IPL52_03630 [Flavobacteriales bacterium]|nr:hypothetical protein [Flavobacteriales bacterium]